MPLVIPPLGSPLGFFVPSPGKLAPASALLADKIDPQTHEFLSLTVGDDPIDAQVLIALKVIRASGNAVDETGARFVDIRKITESAEADIEAEARQALARLVAQGDVQILNIEVLILTDSQQAELTLKYSNTRARDRRIRTIKYLPPTFGVS